MNDFLIRKIPGMVIVRTSFGVQPARSVLRTKLTTHTFDGSRKPDVRTSACVVDHCCIALAITIVDVNLRSFNFLGLTEHGCGWAEMNALCAWCAV